MTRKTKCYLWDMLQAIDAVFQYTAGKQLVDYRNDPMLRDAVERRLIVITEALTQLDRLGVTLSGRISDYKEIIGLRIILVHGYHKVEDGAIWQIVEKDLASLRDEISPLLAEYLPAAPDSD